MLKLKHLFENFEQAKECLKLYNVQEDSLDRLLSYFRVSSNAIYPFRDKFGGDVCFLRLSPAEEKPYEDVQSEIRLIDWLIRKDFPAMKPHPMNDGRLSCQMNTSFGKVNVSCFEEVAGDTLEDCDGSLALIYGYGKTLGRLHKTLCDYPFASERRSHLELLDEVHDRLVRFNAPADIMAEYQQVKDALAELPIDKECYGIVHYDFEADNVLYDEASDSFGVIDFDDAIRAWYALDIVRAIDCLEDVAEDIDSDEAEQEFLKGYRSEKELTEEQIKSFSLMRRLVRLQSYATIIYVLSEDVPDVPDWMTFIIDKLNSKKQSIEEEIK